MYMHAINFHFLYDIVAGLDQQHHVNDGTIAAAPIEVIQHPQLPQVMTNDVMHPTTVRRTEKELEADILYRLRHQFFLPFDALLMVSDAIRDSYERNVVIIQV